MSAISPFGRRRRQKLDEEKIAVIEDETTLGTCRPRDPEQRVVIMVATEYVNISCLRSVGRRKRAQNECLEC